MSKASNFDALIGKDVTSDGKEGVIQAAWVIPSGVLKVGVVLTDGTIIVVDITDCRMAQPKPAARINVGDLNSR